MKELLERWPELEPGRCRPNPYLSQTTAPNGEPVSLFEVLYDGKWHGFNLLPHRVVGDMPILQAAVQEAIEARGWFWRLAGRMSGGDYCAEVVTGPEPGDSYMHDGPTAAEALLSAYLLAVEGTK